MQLSTEVKRIAKEILDNKVSGFFIVTLRKTKDMAHISDHLSGAESDKFFELIGNVEKHKIEAMQKMINRENGH